MKAIFLPTIQHTGTWFCIELLRQHSTISSCTELKDLRFGNDITIIHTHFGDGETWHPKDAGKFIPSYVLRELIDVYPSIIPVRDPLAALLTRQVRCPDLQHSYIIEGFVTLAELKEKHDLFLLPVDFNGDKSFEERFGVLRKLFAFLKLSEEPYIKFWAASWPVKNSVRNINVELYDSYRNGDIEKIIEVIPEEYAYLKGKETILKPFLEELGYKNLLWWDK